MSKELILPGLIDVHTHCREPGAEQKETFKTATRAALAGGFTTILDMPNNPIPTISPQTLEQKENLATGNIYVDLGFHFGANRESSEFFREIQNQIFAYKLYMNRTTGNLLVDNPEDQEEIFRLCPPGKIIMIHGEDETLAQAITLAHRFRRKIHICHVSLQREVEMIREAKEEGLSVTCEVTPHHLFLTRDDEKTLGPFALMRPPLATHQDQEALWDSLRSGVIDIIASDHAPHTKEEKESSKPPSGIPGLETTLPLMLTAVAEGRLELFGKHSLVALLYHRPKEIFHIPNQGATYIKVDTDAQYILESQRLQTKCGWTPFEGMKVQGRVVEVILRNQIIFTDGEIICEPCGQIISPHL